MDHEAEKIATFCSVTGAPRDAAVFHLGAAGGNTEVAINQFLEGAGQDYEAMDDEMETTSGVPAVRKNRKKTMKIIEK